MCTIDSLTVPWTVSLSGGQARGVHDRILSTTALVSGHDLQYPKCQGVLYPYSKGLLYHYCQATLYPLSLLPWSPYSDNHTPVLVPVPMAQEYEVVTTLLQVEIVLKTSRNVCTTTSREQSGSPKGPMEEAKRTPGGGQEDPLRKQRGTLEEAKRNPAGGQEDP